jgi:hypothetical protein
MTGSIKAGVRRRRSLKQVFDATSAALKPRFGKRVIFEHCLPFNVTRGCDEAKGNGPRASGPPSATGTCGRHYRDKARRGAAGGASGQRLAGGFGSVT